MSVDVFAEVEIARPRAEVAAFMFDPTHDAEWTSGIEEVKPLQPGLLRSGAKVDRVARFLGKRLEYRIEVVSAEPETFVEMRATEPFEMLIRYELEDCENGTVVRIRTSGGGSKFFKLTAPMLGRMVQRSIATDLANLAKCLT